MYGEQVYLIDFGTSRRYLDDNGTHIKPANMFQMRGSANFSSLRTHKGEDASRRDDLESLVYSMIYLDNGFTLPWAYIEQIDNIN